MPGIVRVGDRMEGSVPHHANHILYWDTDGETSWPVYCSGHSVEGNQVKGNSKFRIQGKAVATVGDNGWSNDACDGSNYTNTQGSSKFFIQGKAAVRKGDAVSLYPGSGKMVEGSSKFIIHS